MQSTYAIGIDFGGTRIKGALVNEEGQVLKHLIRDTNDARDPAKNVRQWLDAVKGLIRELREGHEEEMPVGLSAPGLTDAANRFIAYMPGRLEGLEQLNWGQELGEPKISVINDAKAAILAEHRFGAGRAVQNLVLLTLGTGVGGAIILDGKLQQGWLSRAGHLGHISLHPKGEIGITNLPGTIEMAVGNATIAQRSSHRYQSTDALVSAYRNGEPLATLVWLESVKDLAVGISSIINVLSPDLILLSGGITKAQDALFGPLQTFLDIYEWRPGGAQTPVRQAQFDEMAGAVGAACFAWQNEEKI